MPILKHQVVHTQITRNNLNGFKTCISFSHGMQVQKYLLGSFLCVLCSFEEVSNGISDFPGKCQCLLKNRLRLNLVLSSQYLNFDISNSGCCQNDFYVYMLFSLLRINRKVLGCLCITLKSLCNYILWPIYYYYYYYY